MQRYPDARILVFAKAPTPGQVKTRLIPALGASGAAALYRQLLEQTVRRAVDTALAPVQCWCAPGPDHPFFEQLQRDYDVRFLTQSGADLGQRMEHAAVTTLQCSGPLLLIGGDCPVLEGGHLRQALEWLVSGMDGVLGPADDGGYVLLGLNRSSPFLFAGVPWGEAGVLEVTRQRFAALRWRWRELDILWDVDRPQDLERLRSLAPDGGGTRGR